MHRDIHWICGLIWINSANNFGAYIRWWSTAVTSTSLKPPAVNGGWGCGDLQRQLLDIRSSPTGDRSFAQQWPTFLQMFKRILLVTIPSVFPYNIKVSVKGNEVSRWLRFPCISSLHQVFSVLFFPTVAWRLWTEICQKARCLGHRFSGYIMTLPTQLH